MISYRRYIVYNNETFHEGNYMEVAQKSGLSISSVVQNCGTGHKVKGWRIEKSFDVMYQLLDAETGKVIKEGKGHHISRSMNAHDYYVANLVKKPTSQYTARVVQKPTREYIDILRRFGREI